MTLRASRQLPARLLQKRIQELGEMLAQSAKGVRGGPVGGESATLLGHIRAR
jgi:hypothetical protein